MKFFEFNIGENQIKPDPSSEDQTVYADKTQLDKVKDLLTKNLPNGKFDFKKAAGHKLIPHIRAWKISLAELKSVLGQLGAQPVAPDQNQLVLSGQFPVSSFKIGDVIYSFVISSKKGPAEKKA